MVGLRWDCSFASMAQAIIGLETPQALPKATFELTKMYGTFYFFLSGQGNTLSSQRRGRWSKISNGSVSAVRTTNSAIPRLRALVASFAPFLICFWRAACLTNSITLLVILASARGVARDLGAAFFTSSPSYLGGRSEPHLPFVLSSLIY